MREIKFRAYFWNDTHTNDQWISSDEFGMIRFWTMFFNWTAHKELMQYAGLKDKNGKEIYEGDIVKDDSEYDPIKFVVWYQGSCQFKFNGLFGHLLSVGCERYLEVIGNIYENEDLLTFSRTKI